MPDKIDEIEEPEVGAVWRHTMLEPRMGPLHAYTVVALLPVFLFPSFITLYIALGGLVVFWLFERKGLPPVGALKALRVFIIGDHRPAQPPNRRDYWR